MTNSVHLSARHEDHRETILRREGSTHHDPRTRIMFETLADRLAQARMRRSPEPVSVEQRRALLISAAILMDEALRLLDQDGSSVSGIWLSNAVECLNRQLSALD